MTDKITDMKDKNPFAENRIILREIIKRKKEDRKLILIELDQIDFDIQFYSQIINLEDKRFNEIIEIIKCWNK